MTILCVCTRNCTTLDKTVLLLLMPATDLPPDMQPRTFDLVSVSPTPLMRNAWLSGRFHRLADDGWLPVGMRFGMEKLP
jgi:CRISPR-associated protein Csc1